jgi:hypothetical protein
MLVEEPLVLAEGFRRCFMYRGVDDYVMATFKRQARCRKDSRMDLQALGPMLIRSEWSTILSEQLEPDVIFAHTRPARLSEKCGNGTLAAAASACDNEGS